MAEIIKLPAADNNKKERKKAKKTVNKCNKYTVDAIR